MLVHDDEAEKEEASPALPSVTPAMVRAGLQELAGFSWEGCAHESEDTVRRIWLAMASAAPTAENK